MPRRNVVILAAVAVVSLACGLKVDRQGSIISYAMRQIHGRYLEDVDKQILFEGAMEGMVRLLNAEFDDEHSAYIKPEQVQDFEEIISQKFGGVGMEVAISPDTGQLIVIAPMPGRPADLAGIRPGDKILSIDGQSTQGLSLRDAVDVMQGQPGTAVVLGVLHEGENKPIVIKIVRDIIKIDTVVGSRRNADGSWNFFLDEPDKIGYLHITSFADNTAEEMRKAVQELLDDGLQGLIIDLRGDPGGYIDQAAEIADMFIRSGVIVSTRHRHGEIFEIYEAHEKGTLPDFPIAVLIDSNSASASEILAACLQDHKRAVVVGERSFGKGTIQEPIKLESNHGILKLTTGTYWRPSEKDINRRKGDDENDDWGVRPDKGYEVTAKHDAMNNEAQHDDVNEETDPEIATPSKKPAEDTPSKTEKSAADPFIQKALQYLRSALAAQ